MGKWFAPPDETAYKVSEETAKEQLAVLFSFYETDFSDFPEDRQAALDEVLGRIAKGIREGRLEIKETDDGPHVIQHTRNGSVIDYRPLDGKIKPRLDTVDGFYKKTYLLLGALSGLGEDAIGRMRVADIRLAESVAAFLLVA